MVRLGTNFFLSWTSNGFLIKSLEDENWSSFKIKVTVICEKYCSSYLFTSFENILLLWNYVTESKTFILCYDVLMSCFYGQKTGLMIVFMNNSIIIATSHHPFNVKRQITHYKNKFLLEITFYEIKGWDTFSQKYMS